MRSLIQSIKAAFVGGVERSVSTFAGEEGVCKKLEHLLGGGAKGSLWWQHLAESDARTGREFKEAWNFLKEEAEQCSQYIGKARHTLKLNKDKSDGVKEPKERH